MRILLVHPGASYSTADVEAGLRYGLEHHGHEVVRYRLDTRIEHAGHWLHSAARRARKTNPSVPKPSAADVFYQAGLGALTQALRHQVDTVLVVSAMYLHPDVIILMKRAGLKVVVLFTESPYDIERELRVAPLVDGCWTMERSVVDRFRAVNPNSGYMPHGWHPKRHQPRRDENINVPSHDVVFVGTGFRERVDWLRSIDWTGIDLGLYGSWEVLGPTNSLRQYLKHPTPIDNTRTAELYRRAKIGLNLYRRSIGFGRQTPFITHAESINPRGYELAACGAFHLSEHRAEIVELFGDAVPTFTTAREAEGLIRRWLPDDVGRHRIAASLPALAAESSWVHRRTRVIGDLQSLFGERALTNKVV